MQMPIPMVVAMVIMLTYFLSVGQGIMVLSCHDEAAQHQAIQQTMQVGSHNALYPLL